MYRLPYTARDIQVGVGALVLREGKVLLVKMTYGGAKGRWINPGGYLEPDEPLTAAAAREVMEETSVQAVATHIVAMRSRVSQEDTHDLYVAFAMDYVGGEPVADGEEVDATRFWSMDEALASPDVMPFTKALLGVLKQGGGLTPKPFTPSMGGAKHYELFGV